MKRNRTVLFIFKERYKFTKTATFIFAAFLFFSVAGIFTFMNTNAYEPAKQIQLNKPVENKETSNAEINQKSIEAILNAKVKYIEFSDSKQYDRERKFVRTNTNMDESEKYSKGSMKKANIQIALEDLNDDGVKEILSYIIQFEFCGKGGGYCTFLILKRDNGGNWKELFSVLTYPDIGIANTKSHGYHDIIFRNIAFRVSEKQKIKEKQEIIIWRWNGKRYTPYIKRETIFNPVSKMEKETLMRWDMKNALWEIIEGR